jgi:hypothetical protein
MTSKNLERSCEDVGDPVLSYAEVKALCAGSDKSHIVTPGQNFPEKQTIQDKGATSLDHSTPGGDKSPIPAFIPQIGQRVVFHPNGSAVKLNGTVTSIEEETVTVQAGRMSIPIFKGTGRFVPERDPVSIAPAARKETIGFER